MFYQPHRLQVCSFKNNENIKDNIHEVNENHRQDGGSHLVTSFVILTRKKAFRNTTFSIF